MHIDKQEIEITPLAVWAMLGIVLFTAGCPSEPECDCDASITKVQLTPLNAGGTGTFGILVDYFGHPLCDNGKLCINDKLAPGLTFSSALPSTWSCTQSGQDVHCCFNDPLPATNTTLPMLELTVAVSPKVGAQVENCASIQQGQPDDFVDNNDTNNVSCITAQVANVDLSIRKRHEGTFVAGYPGVFAIDVNNNSGAPASGVTVTDVLDPAFKFVSAAPSPPWSCSAVAQTVTCAFAGTLPPFTSAIPLQLNVQVKDEPKVPYEVRNCASVSSERADSKPENNTSCHSLEIQACPALMLDLSSGYLNASGMPGAAGVQDDSWKVVAPDPKLSGSPVILTPHPLWQALPGSQWIGPVGATSNGPTGFYTYQSCFCLQEGFTAPMLDLSMLADDGIYTVALNGCRLMEGPPGGNSNTGAPIHVQTSEPSCFQPGENCVSVTVKNDGGPTGFNAAGMVRADKGMCCAAGSPGVPLR